MSTDGASSDSQQQTGGTGETQQSQSSEQTFTQAEVDRIVKERAERIAKQKYADYEELKAKADGAKTVEQQIADLAKKTADAEARALRSDIAAKYGITAEDRDLFLTGSDEATLTAQAERLAQKEADRKKQGNRAPTEGGTKITGETDHELAAFTGRLFGRAN